MNLIIDFPTREAIETLRVGDQAIDAWGHMAEVTRISCRREDLEGRLFVCYYTKTDIGSMSMSRKQDRVTRTVALSNVHTSAQIDALEQGLLAARKIEHGETLTADEIRSAVGAGLAIVCFDARRPGSDARLELTASGLSTLAAVSRRCA